MAVADVYSLKIFDHFESNNERYGHEVSEEKDPTSPLHEKLVPKSDVYIFFYVLESEPDWEERTYKSHDHLDYEDADDDKTHLELKTGFLLTSLIAVQHYLGIDAGIDDQAGHPLGNS